jgi:acyl-CoA synthetase (AMP-forming)/AMP-acid ligase II
VPTPTPRPATSPPAFVRGLADRGPAVALVEDGAVTTYAELATAVRGRAAALGPGRRLVLLVAEPTRECVVTHLAALAAGHVVLLAPRDRPGTVQALRERYRPDTVVDGGPPVLVHEEPQHELHPDLALLLTTSGSTGSPRLVRLSHENLSSNAEAVAASLGLTADDVGVTALPLSYCYGLSVLHSHLAVGAAVLLTRLSVVDPCFAQAARSAGVTSLPGVPYTFDLLDRAGHDLLGLPSLRLVTQAGGRLAPERVRALALEGRERGFDLVVMYGQTEATARMTCLPPHLAVEHPHAVGVPVPGGRVRVDPVPDRGDGVGELVFEGPGVMLGYAEDVRDLARGRDVTELRTGDLARLGPDGLVEIVGRATRFAKVFGLRIDLAHAEELLARHGFVTSTVEVDGTVLIAVEGDHDVDWVARLAAEDLGLPRHAVTAVAVPALPRGGAGKVDAVAVRSLHRQVAPATATPRPDVPVPDVPVPDVPGPDVRALFAEVLERPDATPDDTFVGLGGDSLSYVAVSVQLERELGHLPPAWHVTPIRLLQPRRRRSRWLREVETGVVLRAVAAVLIVATHVGVLHVPGSAHVLLALAGYTFARFRLDDRPRAARLRGTLTGVARVALPSVVWIALAAVLLTDSYGPLNVLLLNHVLGPPTWDASWHFWFVEVLVWTLLGVALLLAVPAVDRCERRFPFALPLAVLGVGLTARFELLPLDLVHPRPTLWLFALGWAAARASTRWRRAAVTAAALVCVPGFFGDPGRDAVILVGVLLVLWVPRLPVPAPLAPALALVAGASLFVYLTHWQVYPLVRGTDPWLAVVVSLAVGVLYAEVAGRVTAVVERRTGQLLASARRAAAAGRPVRATSTPTRVPTASASASRQSPVRSGTA